MKYTINELANSKGVSPLVREALLQMQAELDATNRQVEILSDALAESRRGVAAPVQEPYGYVSTHTNGLMHFNKTFQGVYTDTATGIVAVYTTPPAAKS
jgi:hypothetical protein